MISDSIRNRVNCPFKHDNIDRLFGVPVMPVEELPKVCTCGAPLTYADTVMFFPAVGDLPKMKSIPGVLEVEDVTIEVLGRLDFSDLFPHMAEKFKRGMPIGAFPQIWGRKGEEPFNKTNTPLTRFPCQGNITIDLEHSSIDKEALKRCLGLTKPEGAGNE